MTPRQALQLDRPRHAGEPLADDFIPKQNKAGLAKTLPHQNRIDRGLNEIRKRLGPRNFAGATVQHDLLYSILAGVPRNIALTPGAHAESGRSDRVVKRSGGAALEFRGRNILFVGRDPPAMSEWVLEF